MSQAQRRQANALLERRKAKKDEAVRVLQASIDEDRDPTGEEQAKYDELMDSAAADLRTVQKIRADLEAEENEAEILGAFGQTDVSQASGRETEADLLQTAMDLGGEDLSKLTPAARAYMERFGFNQSQARGLDRMNEELSELIQSYTQSASASAGAAPAVSADLFAEGYGHNNAPAWKAGEAMLASSEYAEAFWNAMHDPHAVTSEQRNLVKEVHADLQSDADTAAGYLTAPIQLQGGILRALDANLPLRPKFRRFVVRSADSLGIRKRIGKASTYARGAEIQAPTTDTSLSFGKKELHPSYWTALIYVSRDLVRRALVPIGQLVADEVGLNVRESKEQEYITGHGASQPLGLFTASDDGISTSRDIVGEGFTTSALTWKGMYDCKYAVLRYLRNAEWGFHPDVVKHLAKIFDSQGRPIWQESLRVDEPDRLLGLPLFFHEFFPNTFSASAYVGIVGDFSYMAEATALDAEMQRLQEIAALTNQVVYLWRGKDDAMPLLEEPFARVTLAAS